MHTQIRDVPPVMLIEINHGKLSNTVMNFDCNGEIATMKLRCIVYGGQNHFTCRFIDREGMMWFHDGITTGARCRQEVGINTIQDLMALHRCEKLAVAVIYARAMR